MEVYKSKLWEGRKHNFVFDRFRGVLGFDAERAEQSTVSFVVESASARCVDDWVKPNQIKDIEKPRSPVRWLRQSTRKSLFSQRQSDESQPINMKSKAP